MTQAKTWAGRPPAQCDLCHGDIAKAFVDGRTAMGPWANMCIQCHAVHGVGLGLGKGQCYEWTPGQRHDNRDASFTKVAG